MREMSALTSESLLRWHRKSLFSTALKCACLTHFNRSHMSFQHLPEERKIVFSSTSPELPVLVFVALNANELYGATPVCVSICDICDIPTSHPMFFWFLWSLGSLVWRHGCTRGIIVIYVLHMTCFVSLILYIDYSCFRVMGNFIFQTLECWHIITQL